MEEIPLSSVHDCLTHLNGSEPNLIRVRGWARAVRNQKRITFLSLYDGSCFSSLQVVIPETIMQKNIELGCAVSCIGTLCSSRGEKQSIELKASKIEVIGTCPSSSFPLQKKEHSFEFLRSIAHLRSRSKSICAIMRLRHALTMATHNFFSERGFLHLATPILTPTDCEGGCDLFQVEKKNGKNFFDHPAYLTVSGQLNAEAFACGIGPVYTFGPTFRAEHSTTPRHLAEFWMIEPEVPFADMQDMMKLSEDYLRFLALWCLDKCEEELLFCQDKFQPDLLSKLQNVTQESFCKISYGEAIKILKKSNISFAIEPVWGIDLQTEHERFLTEQYSKKPTIVFDFPESLKAFYMRINEDGNTVASLDVLLPRIGEVIGGSQREDRLHYLEERMKNKGISHQSHDWYLDLRRFASIPHSGFGAGFERIIRWITGVENIRETIPFPRSPGSLEF
ncbi:asparagine--tRNA ligase [Candidatus Similichlamydia epinepheli]|uniref:asparagine--tRNA ligase n=1 Tax=Candidatus Similichlamydia epinepheli TaxID=1903953 RepID=UPI001EFD277E|nr:asparagine--tRNA ligase [Candidatus Similichlamydia epinepheli]